MNRSIAIFVFVSALAGPSLAQLTAPPMQAPSAPATTTTAILPEGTEVVLRTLTEINSKDSRVGDRFQLEVASPVEFKGRTIIPVGSLAMGEVTRIDKKGMFGKSGKLDTRILYVRVGDRKIGLRGAVGDRGSGNTAATVGTLIFAWPAAFFVTGKSAILPPGTGAVGRLEADLPLILEANPASSAPSNASTPLVVPASPS